MQPSHDDLAALTRYAALGAGLPARQPRGDPACRILQHWPVVVAYELLQRDVRRLEEEGHADLAGAPRSGAESLFRRGAVATAMAPPRNGRHLRAPDLRSAYDEHLAAAQERVLRLVPTSARMTNDERVQG